jgi:hypothetical protein
MHMGFDDKAWKILTVDYVKISFQFEAPASLPPDKKLSVKPEDEWKAGLLWTLVLFSPLMSLYRVRFYCVQ